MPASPSCPPLRTDVSIPAGTVQLPGDIAVPTGAAGIVLFAHGSGSSRFSSRNQYVARLLNVAGLGTVLFDLLTDEEGRRRSNVFDVGLLASRLTAATDWLADDARVDLPMGVFGASTGAAAALAAAAASDTTIEAVVSRGGRPDLAMPWLADVRAPTLLIVGGSDELVLDLNCKAMSHLQCEAHLDVIPGATHLFEEPGALDQVAELAKNWFLSKLTARVA